jgi:HAMP domain-containing protein
LITAVEPRAALTALSARVTSAATNWVERAQRLQEKGVRRIALGDPHARARAQQRLRHIAPQEPASAKDRNQLVHTVPRLWPAPLNPGDA